MLDIIALGKCESRAVTQVLMSPFSYNIIFTVKDNAFTIYNLLNQRIKNKLIYSHSAVFSFSANFSCDPSWCVPELVEAFTESWNNTELWS